MVKKYLSEDVLNRAYIAPNGEVAWKKKDIEYVLSITKKFKNPILGGDIWIIDNSKRMEIPGFSTNSKNFNETDEVYINRTYDEFFEWLLIISKTNEFFDKNNIYYLITFENDIL